MYVMLKLVDDMQINLSKYGPLRKKKMPYITSAERIGIEKGIVKGMEKGMEKGRNEGIPGVCFYHPEGQDH